VGSRSRLTPTDIPKLATGPETHVFDLSEDTNAEARLERVLETHYRNTESVLIADPRSVMLHKSGLVNGKYTLTVPALSHLCSRLAPGLAHLSRDIAGIGGVDTKRTDPELAMSILNRVLRLRFDRLAGCSFILDRSQNCIEGIVGRKYEYFPNLALFQRAREFTAKTHNPAAFCEAVLQGRRLMLRFLNTRPVFDVDIENRPTERFLGGYHFANSEVGDCSVKAAAVLSREPYTSKAISPFIDGGKLPHIKGPKFTQKFQNLLERVRTKVRYATKYKFQVLTLMDQKLGLGGTEDENDKRLQNIVNQLHRRGLQKGFAESVVSTAIWQGSYAVDVIRKDEDNPLAAFERRTSFDIFNALTSEAKHRGIEERENAEQLAYQMLTGKFAIN